MKDESIKAPLYALLDFLDEWDHTDRKQSPLYNDFMRELNEVAVRFFASSRDWGPLR